MYESLLSLLKEEDEYVRWINRENADIARLKKMREIGLAKYYEDRVLEYEEKLISVRKRIQAYLSAIENA